MPIRSGRFNGAGDTPRRIVFGRKGLYRVYNSGDEDITIIANSSEETLEPNCSIDVNLGIEVLDQPTSKDLSVKGKPDKKYEGIYDFLAKDSKVRNGRFVLRSAERKIVQSSSEKGFYRILNSGESPFTVKGGTEDYTLDPAGSIDIGLETGMLSIDPKGQLVEGIYIDLEFMQSTRSGRFRGSSRVIVIDADNADDSAFYRFFNSGDGNANFVIEVERQVGGWQAIEELKPKQSFDGRVPNGRRIAISPKQTNAAIKGSFDFLGFDS